MHTTHHHTQTQSEHPPCFYTSTRAQLMETLWRVAGKRVCLRALQSFLEECDQDGNGYETDGELSATDPGYPGRYCPKQKVIVMNDNIRLYDSESESESEAEAEAEAEVAPSDIVGHVGGGAHRAPRAQLESGGQKPAGRVHLVL